MRAWLIAALLLLPTAAVAQTPDLATAYQLCQGHAAPHNTFHPGFEKCADVIRQYLTERAATIDAEPKSLPLDTTPEQDLVNKAAAAQ